MSTVKTQKKVRLPHCAATTAGSRRTVDSTQQHRNINMERNHLAARQLRKQAKQRCKTGRSRA